MNSTELFPLASPAKLRSRLDGLDGQAAKHWPASRQGASHAWLRSINISRWRLRLPKPLDKLSEAMFGEITRGIEQQLTLALKEVLEQDLALKVTRDFKRGVATMRFHVERDGQPEDIMRGQGGSVANVLSVGLRLFALATLDPKRHRPFLVLDEQDCWLRPDLVPALAKIVRNAGRSLGFQVLMVSHHDSAMFERYADRVYKFSPTAEGLKADLLDAAPAQIDRELGSA